MARIAFVQTIWMEYFGIMQLSAVLKSKGHRVELFIGANARHLAGDIKKYGPDIIGFSCITGTHELAPKIARGIKSHAGAMVVFGGPHPTFFPEIIEEEGVDAVCIGEGEGAISDLADAIDKKTEICGIPNLWVKQDGRIIKNNVRPLIDGLDSLPFPDRSIYYDKYPFLNRSQKIFIAGRGCPYKCTYCFNESLQELYSGKGKYVRFRSVENVLDEIDEARRSYGCKTVYMADDTFILDRTWLFEFLEKYRTRIGLPFSCLARADLISEDIVAKLKSADCYAVFFGVESGDESIRKMVLGKSITDSQIIETASLLKKYGINFRTYNMLGLPGETLKEAFKTIDLNIKIRTDYPWCSILQPYPKTAIRKLVEERGMLKCGVIAKFFFKNSVINTPQIKQLSNLQKLFYWTVKYPSIKPIARILIKLPPNPVFDFLFLLGYAYSYYKSQRMSLLEMLRIGRRNVFSLMSS